jgi:hypothetical protein
VVLKPVVGAQHARNAALGIAAVGFLQLVLGDDERGQARIDRHRGAKPRNSAADHQHVDKVMRDALRVKGDQVAGNVKGHITVARRCRSGQWRRGPHKSQ